MILPTQILSLIIILKRYLKIQKEDYGWVLHHRVSNCLIAKQAFQHFKNIPKDNVLIEHVSFITEDKQGRIWVTMGKGVVVIIEHSDAKDQAPVFTFKKFTDQETHVFVAQDGTVWVSEINGVLLTIHKTHGNEVIDSIPAAKYCWYPGNESPPEQYVWIFTEDTLEHKLYLFMKNCISILDEKKNIFNIIHLKVGLENGFHFTVLFINKTIWLLNRFDIQQFDINTLQLTSVESTNAALEDLTRNTTCLYTDKSGIIWIGTKGYGILKYNPRAEKIHHTDTESIHWMQQTNDGKTMVVKEGMRIYLFDKSKERYTGMLPDTAMQQNKSYLAGLIDAVVKDNNGIYWINKQTLLNYDPAKGTFTRYEGITCFPIYKDHAGDIWFGTDSSFCRYDKKARKFICYPYPAALPDYPYNSLQAIYQDNNGFFWLGTTAGLLRFDPANKRWKHFKNDPHDPSTLSFDLIFCLYPDPLQPNKYLWIGTNGGGLNCFDMQSGKTIRYTSKNGLANDVVYGILSDHAGKL